MTRISRLRLCPCQRANRRVKVRDRGEKEAKEKEWRRCKEEITHRRTTQKMTWSHSMFLLEATASAFTGADGTRALPHYTCCPGKWEWLVHCSSSFFSSFILYTSWSNSTPNPYLGIQGPLPQPGLSTFSSFHVFCFFFFFTLCVPLWWWRGEYWGLFPS